MECMHYFAHYVYLPEQRFRKIQERIAGIRKSIIGLALKKQKQTNKTSDINRI